MRIGQCSFCGGPVYPGHGITFVRNDGKQFTFCRSKCNKNFKLKKNPRRTAYTQAFRKCRGKMLTNDSTDAFERRRHVPVRSSKELIDKTIKAIRRVSEIKQRREQAFYEKRMTDSRTKNDTLKDLWWFKHQADMPGISDEHRAAAKEALEKGAELFPKLKFGKKATVTVTADEEMEEEPEVRTAAEESVQAEAPRPTKRTGYSTKSILKKQRRKKVAEKA